MIIPKELVHLLRVTRTPVATPKSPPLAIHLFNIESSSPWPTAEPSCMRFDLSTTIMLKRRLPVPLQFKVWTSRSILGIFHLFILSSSLADGLSSSVSSVSKNLPTVTLQSVNQRQLAVLDGAEWASIQAVSGGGTAFSKYGYTTIVVGKDIEGTTVVGMHSQDHHQPHEIYQDSAAKVPVGVKPEDALATYIASMSTVHAVLPRSEQVGGSDESIVSGKVVVMGSNELACFAAEGLASFGVYVCMVTTGSPNVKPSKIGKIEIVKPAVGSDGIGFAEYVGTFDSLLDTISNERSVNGRPTLEDGDDDDDGTDENDRFWSSSLNSPKSVLSLLKTRHSCHTYVSTMTNSQNMVAKEGVFGGPSKAEEYAKRVGQASFVTGNPDCAVIVPWSNVGKTVETLLESGVVFSAKLRQKLYSKYAIRGWALGDFWEQSTWPRDSAGSAQVRFGLPVMDDVDLDDERLISEPPYRPNTRRIPSGRLSAYEAFDFSSNEEDMEAPPKPEQENPFIHQVAGVHGIQTEIIESKLDCILFLSAKFCKTCKQISPQYTRMARMSQEETQSEVVYAKVETSGRWGKEVGRYLGVDAVPNFILFRKGQRFGSPLSVSRLPSKKIDQAIQLLESGAEWDPDVLRADEADA